MNFTRFLPITLLTLFALGCGTSIFDEASDDDNLADSDDPYVFAVIGDYGNDSSEEGEVADLVKSWSPEFVITLGDNNYSDGKLSTIEENIGQYYCEFIYNPDAPDDLSCNGRAAKEKRNRFFPTLGNHDTHEDNGEPYLMYFNLPGNERYYDFEWGPIHFFALDSASDDVDLDCCDNEQGIWLKNALANSDAQFKVIYFHHSPYSTGDHGSDEDMQWPFEDWGANTVLSGHDHIYQRIHKRSNPSFPYFVCGVSGKSDKDCGKEDLDEDKFDITCKDDVHGAMKVLVTGDELTFQFIDIDNPSSPLDEFVIYKNK